MEVRFYQKKFLSDYKKSQTPYSCSLLSFFFKVSGSFCSHRETFSDRIQLEFKPCISIDVITFSPQIIKRNALQALLVLILGSTTKIFDDSSLVVSNSTRLNEVKSLLEVRTV